MKAVIVGCGRVGGLIAASLDSSGHDVVVIDLLTRAFDRLPATFGGEAYRGDGTDEDTLRRAGAEGADFLLALTEGDNRNVMAAQLAVEALGIGTVYAKVNDPMRAQAYAELGIGTVCRSTMIADALLEAIGLPKGTEPSVRPGTAHEHAPIGDAVTAGSAATAGTVPTTGPSAAGASAAGASAAGTSAAGTSGPATRRGEV